MVGGEGGGGTSPLNSQRSTIDVSIFELRKSNKLTAVKNKVFFFISQSEVRRKKMNLKCLVGGERQQFDESILINQSNRRVGRPLKRQRKYTNRIKLHTVKGHG